MTFNIMDFKYIVKELNPIDFHIEKDKITLLFSGNKILILNNLEDEFMYSFFINKTLIASNIANEKEFVTNFKKYLVSK